MMKKFGIVLTGLALVSAPVMAQSARTAVPVTGESEVGGGAGIYALAFLAGVAAIIVITVVDDDDDEPVSA